ncbi:MAG: hypothetical protein RBS78_09035 [Coriobacteriia bacterium]|jgi:hypothetical protein|nr:hypothetical protein [Coriobacteriia bacterium]
MSKRDYQVTLARVRSALAGGDGTDVVLGVTFMPEAAVRALAWGTPPRHPAVMLACSRLEPDFVFVNSWETDTAATCRAVAECGTVPFWVVRGPLDSAACEKGWSETLAATVRDPVGLCEAFDAAVEEACASVTSAQKCGAGALVVADDLAGAAGPLVPVDFVVGEIMPRVGRIVRSAAAVGLPVIWHSDGDISSLLEAAAEQCIVAVHPGALEEETSSRVLASAADLGLVVLAGLPGSALRAGVPQAVRAAASAWLKARQGGMILCDDGGVSTPEELAALIAAVQALRM